MISVFPIQEYHSTLCFRLSCTVTDMRLFKKAFVRKGKAEKIWFCVRSAMFLR
jgi:hypothetical protein